MGLAKLFVAGAVALLLCCYFAPSDGAGTCYYSVSHIASYRQYVRTYYYYYRYYYYSCGWWGWSRCGGSYTVYVYYTYSYVSYTIDYHNQAYCCWGYSGSNCNPICYNSCGRCTSCLSPYNCQCQSGWSGSNCCSDLNECYTKNGGCEQNCHNTVGSSYCSCQSGYTISADGLHCNDIDECAVNNGGCSQHCHNSIGGYTCSCDSGYSLSNGHTCIDTNECLNNKGGCGQNCINQPGTYHCTCDSGYTLSSNLRSCIDDNECTNGVANCNHFCLNTAGSYSCYCQSGYELAAQGDSDTCVDTKECLNNNGGCDQTCHNTIGSYFCTCANGYNLTNGHQCADYDECANDAHLCVHHCYNNIGSYTCECRIGYSLDANGYDCHDINECNTNNGGCEHVCNNTDGSYDCSCRVGFLLDEDNHGCSDHDECGTNVHDCDENGDCHNTHGSYYCTCHIGFRLDANNRTCNDINECAEDSSGCTQVCNNLIGSYHCTCYTGFELTADQHNCTDINECNRNTDGCERYCHNLIGSYYCSCQIGYQLSSDSHACVGQPCIPQLTAPEYGQIVCTGNQVSDQSCNFTCSSGYVLQGSQKRNCQLTNEWTGDTVNCQILSCDKLEATGNAYIYTKPCGSQYKSKCEIRCVDGYYINGTVPYYQNCTVNSATNQVYWSPSPECEYVPPCLSNPCQHEGKCVEVSPTKYYCNCYGTYYTGPDCEIGYVDIPSLPVVDINTLYQFVISARPESSIVLNLATSSPSLAVSESQIVFNSTYQAHTLRISSAQSGIYTISFSISGAGMQNYETPKSVLVVLRNPSVAHTDNNYFTTVDKPVGELTPGCCSPGGQIYQCPYSTNTVTFKSTCGWAIDGDGTHETQGIVFASGSDISLPFSIAGVELTLNDYEVMFALPDDGTSCSNCGGSDSSCYNYDFTAEDVIDLIQSNAIAKTYLAQAGSLLPIWVSFSVGDVNITGNTFSLADYTASVTTGASAYLIPGCSSLDLDPNGLYSIFNYRNAITMELDGETKWYNSGSPVCFAINLCDGTDSPVHITIPSEAQTQLLTLSQFQTYVDNGWQFTLQEAQVKRSGVTPPDGIPLDYWIGGDTYVRASSVLPDFDVRLEMNTWASFYSQLNVGVNLLFSGDMYHNSQPTGAEIQGMLTGDVTVLVNMTLNGMTANMTLLTTSTPVLFTMPDRTSSGSLISSGAAMKLSLFSRANDKFFRNVLPLPDGEGSCPMDAFISLNTQNQINYLSLVTWCTGFSMMGYDLPPGSIRTYLYISGATKPVTPNPTYDSSTFVVHSYLTTDSKFLQLNQFVTIAQPTSGPAASIAYSAAANSMTGSISQAEVSILGTHFSIPLAFTSAGFTFQTTTQLFNTFTADLNGAMATGTKTWNDFSLSLSGQFSAGAGGFITSLQSFVYDYTQDRIDMAKSRVTLAETAVNRSMEAYASFTPIISQMHDNLNSINSEYAAAQSAVMAANASYIAAMNAASGLSETAHNIYEELLKVCPDHPCVKECASTSFCRSIMNDVYISEHGIGLVVRLEQLLQHKTVTSMKERWTSDYICRVLTNIKGWARIGFGQTCSYTYIYETSSYSYQQAYHTSVNVSRSEATLLANHQYTLAEPQCEKDTCGAMVYGIDCLYQRSACTIARMPVLNSLNSTDKAAVMPFVTLMIARQNLTVAENRLAVMAHIRSMAQQDVADATITYQNIQNEYLHAQDANISIYAAEASLITLGNYLQGISIENLFNIDTISFQTIITDTSPKVLPIVISYTLAGLGSQTVQANAEFTASLPVLQRELAKTILQHIGSVLNQHIGKRSLVLPTFNEQQFEQRCAMLYSVKEYLEQIDDSLSTTLMTLMEAGANISTMIAKLNDVINYVPSGYADINITYLATQYNTLLTSEQLDSLVSVRSEITSVINSTALLKDYTMNSWNNINLLAAFNWLVDTESAHQAQKIGSVAGQNCYSFADCLNAAANTMMEILEDTPGTAAQTWLQSIPMARQQLLELALNVSLNLTTASNQDFILLRIINQTISSNYWCSGLPEIIQSLEPSLAVEVGDTITIDCVASSSLPMSFSWKKDGFVISGQNKMIFTKTNANRDDEGQYQCLVTNAVGTVESTFTEVVIYIPPNITVNPSDYETYEGNDNGGYFACNATGHPIPMFQWYFRQQNSSQWVMVANDTNELVVPKPTKANQGWYKCHAIASIGQCMSTPAHLSILQARTSKLVYNVVFSMNITTRIPVDFSGSGTPETTPPPSTTTIEYFRNELTLGKASVDHLQIGFNLENNALLVRIDLSAYYSYKANETMEVQVPIAQSYQTDLNNALSQLEMKVQDGVFWFEVEGDYFETVHQSASVADLNYWCPDGTVLRYSNFLCLSCSPGSFYTRVNGTGQCNVCPKNTFQQNDGSHTCIECPPMSETVSNGSRWDHHCISYCPPGYNSTNGLQPCSVCPLCMYNNDFKQTSCIACTNEHLDNETIGCPSNCSIETVPTSDSLLIIVPASAGGFVAAVVVLLLVVVVIGVAIIGKRRKNEASHRGRVSNQARHSIAVPNDFLNLVPESERVEQAKYDIQDEDVEATDREVVNPLFLESQQEPAYESLNHLQVDLGNDEKDKMDLTSDEPGYSTIPVEKAVGGIAARKVALFGR